VSADNEDEGAAYAKVASDKNESMAMSLEKAIV
jgi:hypothetical protein